MSRGGPQTLSPEHGPAADAASTARRFDLVVFDWDGTLIDSIGAIVACTRAALAELGRHDVDDEPIRQAIGLGLDESLQRFLPGADRSMVIRLREAYSRHWVGGFHVVSQPFAASATVLDGLARDGYLLAVATAKSRRGLERDLTRTGLGGRFHASRTVDEAPAKPHPGMLQQLMEELGVEASRTVMVGDTVWDLEMAANAGVLGVAVTSGAQPRQQLEESPAAACLAGVAALPAWLANGADQRAKGRRASGSAG